MYYFNINQIIMYVNSWKTTGLIIQDWCELYNSSIAMNKFISQSIKR